MDLQDCDNGNGCTGNGLAITDPFNLKNEYAVAGFDRAHVFNFNYIYDLPEFRNRGAFMRFAAGGWEISGITRFWTGTPLDVVMTSRSDGQSGGDPGNFIGVVRPEVVNNNFYGGQTRNGQWFNPGAFAVPQTTGSVGGIGRNFLRGPGINNWDISLFKNFNLRENMRFQIRLETFNTFNHAQAGQVNNVLRGVVTGSAPKQGDPIDLTNNVGRINAWRDPRNVQIGAKFYF